MTVLRDYAAAIAQPMLPGQTTGGPTTGGQGGGSPSGGAQIVGADGTTPAAYDEVVGPDGTLRAAWKPMAEAAVSLTERDLIRVDGEIERFLADDGVVYGRPGERPEAWRLDPMPLVIDAAQWTPLEIGLAQRAELLNAILVDLYGKQRLLSEGIVPPAVVLGHSGFTRVVARPSAIDPRPLVLVGTDLGRDPSGEWRVLADRAQAPSGMGYAMENRRVISRVLPELYREASLHRIEPYFWALRSALIQSANGDLADPRVVVLSSGPHSETAYDQSFIAATLGFPLVLGSDLVVRDGWVHVRSPGGGRGGDLQRVDVILRRLDAAWSDPLELRGGSRLGVAGLVEAVRRGRVRIVNGLGAGVLENPGLHPYMSAICEALLGEPLRLSSVPTWWCGDPVSLDHVLDGLDTLVLRTLDGPADELAGLGADQLRERLLSAPHRFVGQERPVLSQAPTWDPAVSGAVSGVVSGAESEALSGEGRGAVRPRSVTLRTFTLRYGSAYRPLIGGLASVLEGDRVSSSKDVWVLKGALTDADQGLAEVMAMTSARSITVMVPRTLEDLFWFGRYAERAEDLIRLVLVAHSLSEGVRTRSRATSETSLEVMMGAVRRLAGSRHPDVDSELRSLLLDPMRKGSVAYALSGLRDVLAGVREQLSGDVWRTFGTTERAAGALGTSTHSHQVSESAGRMLTGVLALQGVTASMIRDSGWHMIGAGRAIERATQLCHLLRATTTLRRGIDVDREILNAVLSAAESGVTHRRRYRGYVRPAGVLDLLLVDPENPRSLAFCLTETRTHLAALPASTGSTRPERLLDDLVAELAGTDVASLVAIGGVGRPNLERFLDTTIAQLNRLADAVAELHFTTGPAPRSLGARELEGV